MKINLDDPRLTAFALGELEYEDAQEIARAIIEDKRLMDEVNAIRDTSFTLFEAFEGLDTNHLKPEQYEIIHSAGSSITSIEAPKSEKVSFFKNPFMAGVGAAAAVALGFFMFNVEKVDRSNLAQSEWSWSGVPTSELVKPVLMPSNKTPQADLSLDKAKMMSEAMASDTVRYRNEVGERIKTEPLSVVVPNYTSRAQAWQNVFHDPEMLLPLASAATSWPLLERFVNELQALPAKHNIRVEELVNQFSYSSPSMICGEGISADIEVSKSPWNAEHVLLGVHIKVDAALKEVISPQAVRLTFNPKFVDVARLVGYSDILSGSIAFSQDGAHGRAMNASSSRGNYVFYEIKPHYQINKPFNTDPIVTLNLSDSVSGSVKNIKNWKELSQDFQFASIIATAGLVFSDDLELKQYDINELHSLMNYVESSSEGLFSARREAFDLIRRAIQIEP